MRVSTTERIRLVFVPILSATALLLIPAGQSGAQGPAAVSYYPMQPGTILDPVRNVIYVMSDKGGVAKIDIATGREIWHSRDAGKPLALGPGGGRLLSQMHPTPNASHLGIAVLNVVDGQTITKPDGTKMQAAIALPPGVKPTIIATPSGQFSAAARLVNGKAVVTWKSSGRPRRGLPPGVEEKLQPKAKTNAPGELLKTGHAPARGGAFTIDLGSGSVAAPTAGEAAVVGQGPADADGSKWRAVEVTGDDVIAGFQGPQFYSVDKRDILVRATPTPDAKGVYSLIVYDRGTKQSVGRFTSHHAVMPFYVAGGLIVYESTRATLAPGAGERKQSALIRAVKADGTEAWRYAVHDIHTELTPP
jgi:hypothetical protein